MLGARRDGAWVNVLDDVILGDPIHAQEAPAAADARGCAPPPLLQAPKTKKTTETRAAASVTTPLRLCPRRGV